MDGSNSEKNSPQKTEEPKDKTISIEEFWKLGFIQEINRRVLHPCGLAMSVIVEDDESSEPFEVRLGPVYDSREDPEGFIFGWDKYTEEQLEVARQKKANVDALIDARQQARINTLGYTIQDVPEKKK